MTHTRIPLPALTGYWQSWNLPGGEALPVTCVPYEYTDVIIAFVAPDASGALSFAGPNIPTRDEVRCLQRRGQRVLLSIGGGGVAVALDNADRVARFSDGLYKWICALGVNGVDIDIEHGMHADGSPCEPQGTALGVIRALDCVLAALPPHFMLTMAPETVNLVGAIARYGGAWGNYLPLIMHFSDRLTRVHMQYYNSGPMPGLDGRLYEAGTVDFAVALTEAVIEGFPIADTGVRYCGLPSWKVSIGLPATPHAAGNGYLTPAQVDQALCMLRTGARGECQPRARAYCNLGGLMTWSIQWDAQNCFEFACNGARALCI